MMYVYKKQKTHMIYNEIKYLTQISANFLHIIQCLSTLPYKLNKIHLSVI